LHRDRSITRWRRRLLKGDSAGRVRKESAMAGSFATGFLESFNRAAILLASCTLLAACSGGGGD
jgi:hypothetical protein